MLDAAGLGGGGLIREPVGSWLPATALLPESTLVWGNSAGLLWRSLFFGEFTGFRYSFFFFFVGVCMCLYSVYMYICMHECGHLPQLLSTLGF